MVRAFLGGLAAVLLTASSAWAVEARLVLPDGSPAASLQVSVVGRPGSVDTDSEGRFALVPDPPTPFTLVVTSGTGEVFPPIDIDALPDSGQLEIRLAEVIRESVTVVSGIAPSVETLPAAAATLIAEEDLEQRHPQRLVDALEGIPGVSRIEEGASGVPVIRGFARGRTLILLDGARITAERRAGPSASYLDALTLSSVEVTRGPGAVAYGSDAFGGVIDARTRDPEPGPWHLKYEVSGTSGGSGDRGAAVAASGGLGSGSLLISARAREAGNGEDGRGAEIFNSSYEDRGAALRYLLPLDTGVLRLSFQTDEGRDVGKPASDSRVTRAYYPEESSRRFVARYQTQPLGSWDGMDISGFVGTYRLVLDRDRFATPTATRRIERSDVEADDASIRATTGRELGGGHLKLGLDVNGRLNLHAVTSVISFNPAGAVTSDVDTVSVEEGNRIDSGAFAIYDRALGKRLSLSAGLRGDRVESENRGGFFGDRSVTDDAVSGHLALTAELASGLTGTLQAARGFRVPLLSDRYFVGPSGRGIINGNPELEPESSLQYDGSLRWTRGRSSVAVFAYHYTVDDLIERFRTGNDFFFRNRGEAEIRGAEIEAQTSLAHGFEIQLGLTYSRGEDVDTGDALLDIPATAGTFTTRWHNDRVHVYGRASVSLEDDRPGSTEAVRPGVSTFDLGAGYRFAEWLEARLVIDNVTDKLFFESPDAAAGFAPGRSFLLALSGRI